MDPGEQVPDVEDLAKPVLDLYGAHDEHHDESRPADDGPDTRYARGPLFPVDSEHYEAVRAATALDSNRYLHSGLTPVDCRRCGASVKVKKLAPGYTAVQWSSAATQRCEYFGEARFEGRTSSRSRSCPHMTASIKHAVAEGLLEETPGESGESLPGAGAD